MNQIVEPSLIETALRGDAAAFAVVYGQLRDRVYGFAVRMLGDAATAEDITQETFIFLIENSEKFSPARGSLLAFLCGVARNRILHHLRRHASRPEEPQDFAEFIEIADEGFQSPLDALLNDELARHVMNCVAELPPALREVIILREMNELTYDEISRVTETDLNLVKVRLHRARKHLAGRLAVYLQPAKEEVNELC
jgi:RNA polymerase sigma-70 factor (ECF subfamily)